MMGAFFFTTVNGYVNGRYLTHIHEYPESHLNTIEFQTGSIMFWVGLIINWHSDSILRSLRKPGDTGYKIPKGGMFEYVSGANYLGEIIEWLGFAIATGGAVPAVCFAASTICNIGPRAVQHHNWYLTKFEDYKKLGRKRIIPFVY